MLEQEERQSVEPYQIVLPASVEETLYSLQVNPQLFAGLPLQNQLEGLTGAMLVKHHRKRVVLWSFILIGLVLYTLLAFAVFFLSPMCLIAAPFILISLFIGYHFFMMWFGMKMVSSALR